jgi:hypothetical protein
MRQCLIWIWFLFTSYPIIAQKSFQPKQVDFEWKGVVYRNETTANLTLHTNGYTIAYNKGKIKTFYKPDIRDYRNNLDSCNYPFEEVINVNKI